MLDLFRGKRKFRKLRLFACACYRRLAEHLGEEDIHPVVLVSERVAEGSLDHHKLREARRNIGTVRADGARASAGAAVYAMLIGAASVSASHTALHAAHYVAQRAVEEAEGDLFFHRDLFSAARNAERAGQAALLHDIFGPLPFRTRTIEPGWLAWNGRTVERLAAGVYEERELPSGHLEPTRLAILADALEEAGCSDVEILGHLRQEGAVHVRGCWAVDLLLKKD
jgi:hypothetical protein